MANLNPVAVLRDISNSVNCTRQAHEIVGRVAGGASKTVTVETKLKSILSAVVINETDGAVVATTISDSTATVGTKKVAFAVVNAKDYSYLIVGLFGRTATVDTISNDTTITYEPIKGGF